MEREDGTDGKVKVGTGLWTLNQNQGTRTQNLFHGRVGSNQVKLSHRSHQLKKLRHQKSLVYPFATISNPHWTLKNRLNPQKLSPLKTIIRSVSISYQVLLSFLSI